MTIAIYARSVKDNHPEYLSKLITLTQPHPVQLLVYAPYLHFLQQEFQYTATIPVYHNHTDIKNKADFIISLGGDGTILETLDLVRDSGIPVLGVNTGRLGFLASVYKEDLEEAIALLLNKRFSLDKRDIIELSGPSAALFDALPFAVNELTVMKKDSSSMITIETLVNGEFLNAYWADGLIVSTPTGSTGYSLSCGGPIIVPGSSNFVITPIAPHNLNVRPIVLSNHSEISITVRGRSLHYMVSLDSRSANIDSTVELKLKKASFTFNILQLDGQHFFKTIRNKLMWGLDKRN